MSKHKTIEWHVGSRLEDHDDVLSAAAEEAAEALDVEPGYDMAPRWLDDEREIVLLDVPADTPTDDAPKRWGR